MVKQYVLLLAALVLLNRATKASLPEDIPKCHAGDVDCITKTIHYILGRYPEGNPEFGLTPINSVQLKDVLISKANPNSAIQLNFKFNTLNLTGLEKAVIKRVVGFEEDLLKSKYEVYMQIPELKMIGDYETSGKILLLPINGKGNSEMSLTDARIGVKVKAQLETVNGKDYGKISKVKSTLEVGRLHVNLENLFGQRELSDVMNDMINKNWQEVWLEVQEGVNTALGEIVKNIIGNVLKELPYDEFYLKS